MSDKLERGTKQDLKMLIGYLDKFYFYRGKKFWELLEEDDREELSERVYHLKADLEEKLDELVEY
tara:strand:+ start:376 stop:570 length:195 start_codon:yes stop_codon:yes gene_type:complete